MINKFKVLSFTILSLVVLMTGFTPKSLPNDSTKPNVLFIAVDDLKPLLGCYGDTVVKTPNIDALANQGITFMRNYCQQAVCAPSRASLLTGRYPDQIKVWDLETITRELNPGIVTLPQYFKGEGYTTVATGKIFDPRSTYGAWGGKHDAPSWSWEYEQPHDFYNVEHGQPMYFYASKESIDTIQKLQSEAKSLGFTSHNDIRNYVKQHYFPPTEKADVPYDAYIDGALSNHGIHLMDSLAKQEKPFFLAVGFKRPHLPFNAPTEYWDLYDRQKLPMAPFQSNANDSPDIAYHNSGELRNGYTGVPDGRIFSEAYQRELVHGYYAATSYIDDMIGRLLNRLIELGLDENTVVVIWGDHGWHLGDHGLWCKHTNFEQATRAPLIIRPAKALTNGIKYSHPTEFTDIAPTLCSLVGLETPVYFEGESLAELFYNPEKIIRENALSQYPRGGDKYMGYSIRTNRYRYTAWIERNTGNVYERELYDYQVDSLETINFIGHPEYDSVSTIVHEMLVERLEPFDIPLK